MRLLIISHMPHHRRGGQVVGWAPTVREIDQIASRFDTVRHIACLHEEDAPASAIEYAAQNVELVPVPPSGAPGALGKLDVLRTSPRYVRAILDELPNADLVHVRGPAHIALLAMLVLSVTRAPKARWFKYAGNWSPKISESPSYTFQRWWLRHSWHRGLVTINGQWPQQQPWVRTFFNPSLGDDDLARGKRAAATKRLVAPLRLIFVGTLEPAKGAGRALRVARGLIDRGIALRFELIGDGSERASLEALTRELDLVDHVAFLGWRSPEQVYDAYARAHVQVLPSRSEGWPKVLSEGMAFGVVPVASAVSSIPQYIQRISSGAALPPDDTTGFVDAVAGYVAEPERWLRESRNAVEAARWFSFGHYLDSLDAMLAELHVR